MRCLLPLTVYCISLVCLQLQAAPVEERPDSGTRSALLNKLIGLRDDKASASESPPDAATPSSAPGLSPKWLPGLPLRPAASGARVVPPSPGWLSKALQLKPRAPRARRHTRSGSRGGHHNLHHAQLMRVGCVLGTCQVQNLSHRLYQLIGQSGREESSPINPRSPHSYG